MRPPHEAPGLRPLLAPVAIALLAAPAAAQHRYVLTDRTTDSLWLLCDRNRDGVIDESAGAGELRLFYSAANATDTPGPLNPSALAVRPDGLVVYGDQDALRRHIVALRDLNFDGDALDAGESAVLASSANASGISFAFPLGIAFDSAGRVLVVNASNAFGNDAVYVLADLTADGDADDTGEIQVFAGAAAFGADSSPLTPAEIVPLPAGGYLRLTGNPNAVYRLDDTSGEGSITAPGEFFPVFDATALSGVPVSAGFGLCASPSTPSVLYTQQVTSIPVPGTDQVLRLEDLTADGDFLDLGEASIVYETSEAGFTGIDVVARHDGSIFLTDNSGNRVARLIDLTGDGDLNDSGERIFWFANSTSQVAAARQIDHLPCPADFNGDFAATSADITVFLTLWFADLAAGTTNADFDRSGSVNSADITAFLTAWFASLGLC